ncbi:MAG: class I SAM-dependent methyltransferase [Thermoplasmata archaeon]
MGRNTKDSLGSEILTTVDTYDAVANQYRERTLKEGDRRFQERMLSDTLEMLPSSPTILDLGCGDGRDTSFLDERDIHVTGLDLSKSMINLARQLFPDCKFVRGNMAKTPFADDTFDCVWSSASMIHFPKKDLSKVEKEIHRILKRNGLLVFSFKEGIDEGYESGTYGRKRYYSYYTLAELEEMLTFFHILTFRRYPEEIMGNRFVYCWLELKKTNRGNIRHR